MTAASVDEVVALFERWGSDPYDEAIGQLEHALQTAALAKAARASESLIAAALLHDVGHLLDLRDGRGSSGADLRHEETGPAWLRPLFPPTVTAPIVLHVAAKRYLCAVDPGYEAGLSAGSRLSLRRQGGPMTPAEVVAFERRPGWSQAVRLRRWDDEGKVDGLDVPPLVAHLPQLRRLAASPTLS